MSQNKNSGVVLTNEEIVEAHREGRAEYKPTRSAFDANITARDLRADSEIRVLELLLQLHTLDQGITQEKADRMIAASREGEAERLRASAVLETQMNETAALLPEAQRAEFIAGFLRHHDLVRSDEHGGFATNTDEELPHAGNYIPAGIVRGRVIE